MKLSEYFKQADCGATEDNMEIESGDEDSNG
jgi:hypothetical protein